MIEFRAAPGRLRRLAVGAVAAAVVVSHLVGAFASPAQAQLRPSNGAPNSFADLAERLLPAVVNISTTQVVRQERQPTPPGAPPGERRRGPDVPQFPPGSPFEEFFRDFFDRQGRPDGAPRRQQSLGSGFIIDAAGYVVTNNHVIAEADEIRVILHDNTQLSARVVGRDARTDLALLRVQTTRPLTAVGWGNSDAMRVGDWVLAIGNPFGLGGTVTQGIISARARDINAGPYDDFLQTDAAINRGNSGGPMFSLQGEVVGINTAIYSPTGTSVGIGFAIPSALAQPVIAQLREHGRVRRGWLGVNIQTVNEEIAESLGLDRPRGALVARVTERGPAEAGQIQPGDVVLRFDGREVTDMRRLPRLVAETPVDKTVPVVVWRRGREVTLDVRVGELPDDQDQAGGAQPQQPPRERTPPAPPPLEALGMSLNVLTPELRQRFEIGERIRGVLITRVQEGSSAAERGLRAGDVIVEVGQEEVTTPQQVAAKIQQARAQNRRSILVMIERQGEQRFVGLQVEPAG
ncbi:MAG: DegQ family serine endoprotease [Alphaproteobacteria bacterium]|nr:DegQ family serine endoprotease [Alphaproteobacteria bacterium]